MRELTTPNVLPGCSGGKMSGRSKADAGKEEKEEEDSVRRVEKEAMNAVLTANLVHSTTSSVLDVTLKETQVAFLAGSHFHAGVKVGIFHRWRLAHG